MPMGALPIRICKAAEAEAVRTFHLNPEQRSRLVLQERGCPGESPSRLAIQGKLRQAAPEPVDQCPEPTPLWTVGNSLQGARLALFQIDHPSQV